MNTKKLPLAFWIFVGLVIGIVAGLALMAIPGGVDFAKTYVKPFGTIFLNLIKFIVVPIVLFSITAGIISMGDIKKLGSVGVKTIVYYMCTTALAVVIALVLANLCRGFFPPLDKLAAGEYTASDPVSFMDTLVNIFPANVIEPMRSASMLQVIVIAILFGVGILVAGEKGLVCAQVVDSFNEVSMKVMDLIIRLSPVGVACLLAPVVAENGPKILGALAAVLLVAYIGYVIHALCVYSFSMAALARISPVAFFREMVPAMMMAFSSASSVGTLPFTLECAEKLGARKEIASFIIPLGATINMDGTAIYQGVCALFIANAYGIPLALPQQLTIILTCTLASVGTAGVPGAGAVMLGMVLQSVGLPVEGVALVLGIDRVLDMARTAVNVAGDLACAVVVSAAEPPVEKGPPA